MKTFLDWSAYENAGMGDAYADIPRHGGDFAKAVAVCIDSRQCETRGKLETVDRLLSDLDSRFKRVYDAVSGVRRQGREGQVAD